MKRITLAAPASAFVCLAEFPWGQEAPGLLGLHQDAVSGMQCGRWDLHSMESRYKPIFYPQTTWASQRRCTQR